MEEELTKSLNDKKTEKKEEKEFKTHTHNKGRNIKKDTYTLGEN